MPVFVKDISIEKKTKDKLEACVKSYRELFPAEYEAVVSQINKKRWRLHDMEFGQTFTDSIIRRSLFEIPEALQTIIVKYLTDDEMTQFKGLKGSRWFAKHFVQFRTPQEI